MNLNNISTATDFDMSSTLPDQCRQGTWVGRAWLPAPLTMDQVAGPHVIKVNDGRVYDISALFPMMADLFANDNPVTAVGEFEGRELMTLDELLRTSRFNHSGQNDSGHAYLLSPNDIQSTKACGVTFVRSLLERIIEERAQGNVEKAKHIRKTITEIIGSNLSEIVPGSKQAMDLKRQLIEMDYWSQYLEVGIGKDAEVFTKSQPLSSVTSGAQIGVLRSSEWNNPEPEIVFAVNPTGKIIGAALGNDVNLRDYEGRSALLLGKAKDQNGSCSIGPLLRLFDNSFDIDDVMSCSIKLVIQGEDGFILEGENRMNEISRHPQDLVDQTLSANHQYPDGLMLFVGTMFAPTEDRDKAGDGFTHKPGDRVEISTPHLGKLVNWVNYCDAIPRWEFGIHQFINYLGKKRFS
jgi:fumarylacetoacetate (FAA) hydrolase family protein